MAEETEFDPKAFKDFEHDAWTEVASTYHESFALLTRQLVEPLLDAVGAKDETRLLETACGTGQLAAAAAERGAGAIGLDFVPEMVTEAAKLFPAVDFREGDAEALPFEDGSFEAVACNVGILHFPHPEQALAEAFRVLAPGGRFAFTAWCPPERSPLFALLLGTFQEHGDMNKGVPAGPPMFRFAEAAECLRVLAGAGFVDTAADDVPATARFPDASGVMEMVRRGTARTQVLLKHQSEAAVRKIEETVLEKAAAFASGGRIEIPAPAMLASGRKP